MLAEHVGRFATLNHHQLAGHVANLEFWLGEVRHCLEVIDTYGQRFQRLKSAQNTYVSDHHTVEFSLHDPCCTQTAPQPPRRVPHAELQEARRALTDATYRFLLRSHREDQLDEGAVRSARDNFGIGIDPRDLKRSDQPSR